MRAPPTRNVDWAHHGGAFLEILAQQGISRIVMKPATGGKTRGPSVNRRPAERFRLYARRILAGAALVVSVVAFLLAIAHKYVQIDPLIRFHILVYTELTKSGIDLKTNESEKLFDITLILIGGLVGLMLAKPNEARVTLRDKPELLMFISAMVVLCSSIICHEFYLTAVSDVYLQARVDRTASVPSLGIQPTPGWKTETVITPNPKDEPYAIEYQLTMEDVRDPAVEYLLKGQIWFLVFGTILSCIAFASANLLKESANASI
jgi:hypothetical protein